MNVLVEVEGINELVAKFGLIQHGLQDMRQLGVWDWVESEYKKIITAHFNAEGNGKSGKWKALSPKYKAAKQKRYGDMPINQRSTAMFKSMVGGFGYHVEKKAQEMEVGSRLPTAAWAHKGGKGRPARPLIDFSPEQEKQLVAPIQKKLSQLIDNARLKDERGF
jgi:phage gpG-like protein